MRPALATTLLAALFTCALAAEAPAQEQYMAQADSQLARIARTLGPRYSESRQMIHRGFSDTTRQNLNFTWDRASYVVAAAGDIHVAGIKLRLYNENNALVAADTTGSKTPRIIVTVPDFGTFYRLEMAITGCSSEDRCYVALMPYRRQ